MEKPAGSPIHPGARYGDLDVHEVVGRGAHSTVYRATDTLLHREVALKVLDTASLPDVERARDKILREARMVARLNSPNVVTLYRVHELPRGAWAFEMEYLAGGSLSERIESGGPIDPTEARRILQAVLRALDLAHERGIVHHDIKPANVLLGEDGSVRLTDFGLGRFIVGEPLAEEEHRPRGTPYYMAPEVVMGLPGTPLSDLWSVGVLLYRMLTGRMPFPERTIPSLFLAIQNAMPTPLDPTVPAPLAAITLHCLAKAPYDRPTSAEAVLAELDRTDGPLPPREMLTAAAGRTPSAVVGRHLELEKIRPLVDQAAAGEGRTVLLLGEPGIGKTAFATEIGREVRARGFRWIEARLAAVEGLRRPLLAAIRHCLEREAEASSGSGESETPSSRQSQDVLEQLRRADDAADEDERLRASWQIEHALSTLADERPLAVLIEDLQVCERAEIRALAGLSARLASKPVFLAFTWRTQDPQGSESGGGCSSGYYDLIAMPQLVRLELEPLRHEALRALIESTAGVPYVPLEIVERVAQASEGIPLYAITLFRHLEATGEIEREGGSLRVTDRWGRTPPPAFLRDMVRRRLDQLASEDRSLLETAAVAGVEFDGHILAHLCGRPLLDTLRALQRLYRDRMLLVPLDHGYRFAHALYRDAIYADLAPDLRRALHEAWADGLEARGVEERIDPELLGLHWERAGRLDRAGPLLRTASRAAVRRGELARAWDLARRSGALKETASSAELREDLRTLLSLMPTYTGSAETERVESLYDRIRMAAEELGDEAMLGYTTVAVSWNDFVRAGAGAVDAGALRHAVSVLPEGVARGNGEWLLANLAEIAGDLGAARAGLERARIAFAAEHAPEHDRQILNALGYVCLAGGRNEEARRHFEEAVAAVPAGDAPVHEALCRTMAIATASTCGDTAGCGDALDVPIRMLEQSGQTARAGLAMQVQARCYRAEGRVRQALAVFDRAEPMLADGTMRSSLAQYLVERADLDIATGAVSAGTGRLAHAKAIFAKTPDPSLHAYHLTNALLATVTCRPDEARVHLQQALDEILPRGRIDEMASFACATALLCGLGLEVGDLPGRVDARVTLAERPPMLDVALRSLAAAGEARSGDPQDPGAAYRDARIGMRQAEMHAAADLVEARAHVAGGRVAAAQPHLDAAAAAAHRLDHLWLELTALRTARDAGLEYDTARVVALRRLLAERNPDRTSDTAAWFASWFPPSG